MIAKMPPTQLALTGICGVLTLILAYEVAAPIPPFRVPKSMEIYRPAAITFQDTATAPSAASFGDIDAHPIFSASRTPIASHFDTAHGGGASGAFPTDVSLIGVIIEGQTRMALIKTASEPFARSVPQGGEIEGWTVSEVAPDKIVLSSGATKQEILLAANRGTESSGLSVNPGVGTSGSTSAGAGTIVGPNVVPAPNSAVGPGAGASPGAAAPTPPNLPPAISNKPSPDTPPPAPHR
jgi:hypothetical protein